jgi:feruloyl esterase
MLAVYRVPAAQFGYATEFFKYFVFNDSLWDYRNYEISRAAVDARELDDVLSPNSSDLSAFARRGGKLLLAHGWSDPVLNALQTIDYLEAVKRKDASADAYVRLFLMPGVLHCEGGTGCDQADWLGSITQWVERGTLPDRIVASRLGPATEGTPQAVARTRPLCAYPRQAVYSGSGSTDEAQNFVCK